MAESQRAPYDLGSTIDHQKIWRMNFAVIFDTSPSWIKYFLKSMWGRRTHWARPSPFLPPVLGGHLWLCSLFLIVPVCHALSRVLNLILISCLTIPEGKCSYKHQRSVGPCYVVRLLILLSYSKNIHQISFLSALFLLSQEGQRRFLTFLLQI